MAENLILKALPGDERQRLLRAAVQVDFVQYDVIAAQGAPIEHVYFVQSGLVSLFGVAADGRGLELGTIGLEGALGSMVAFGARHFTARAIAHFRCTAIRVPARDFRTLYGESSHLASAVNRRLADLLRQSQQNALCHALHSLEARFSRRVLQSSDTNDHSVLELTQEYCAQMLGVQRTSVSMVARALQVAGAIDTVRGKIRILDRAQLEAAACECYLTSRTQHDVGRDRAAEG
jgi:CRP-like cAMP-binding protein